MKCEQIPEGLAPRTILVVRDSRVGDVLMTTPAIRRIKERFPEAALDVLVSRYAKRSGVLDRNPCIRRVLTCPRNRWLRRLRCFLLPRYDLVIPIRRRKEFDSIRSGCMIDGGKPSTSPHVVHGSESMMGFPRDDRFVPMEIHPSPEEIDQAAREIPDGRVGVYPSCHGSTISRVDPMNSRRVWRAAEVQAAVRGLTDAGYPVVLFGGSAAEERALRDLGLSVPILSGGSITLLAARLARLRAFVTVDTGPMHVAAAMDVPIVALYGPTRPEVTGPYMRSGRSVVLRDESLPCLPCRGKKIDCRDNVCMTYHTPGRILEALGRLLGEEGMRGEG
jgi:ADP-heptose:LPS heptosyltransferase